MSRPQVIEMFRHWDFPDKFYLVVGTQEMLGAIGLLVPWLAGYAASGLIVLMIGAAPTHLVNGEGLQVLRPLIHRVTRARPFPAPSVGIQTKRVKLLLCPS